MSKFDERVTQLIQTVVGSELTAIHDQFLDEPTDFKAESDAILRKLEEIGNWFPRIKSEIKDIQDTLRSEIKEKENKEKEEKKKSDNEKIKKGLDKLKRILKEFADKSADDMLPDTLQDFLNTITDHQFFNEYDDTGWADIIENMIFKTIENIPEIIAIRTAADGIKLHVTASNVIHSNRVISAFTSAIDKLKSDLNDSLNSVTDIIRDIGDGVNDKLDSMDDELTDIKSVVDYNQRSLAGLGEDFNDLNEYLDRKFSGLDDGLDELSSKIDSVLNNMQQCCDTISNIDQSVSDLETTASNILEGVSNNSTDISHLSDKIDNYGDSIIQAIDDIPQASNAQTLSSNQSLKNAISSIRSFP